MENELNRIELPESVEASLAIVIFYMAMDYSQIRTGKNEAIMNKCEMFKPVQVEKITLFYTGFTIRFKSGSMIKIRIKPNQVEQVAKLAKRCGIKEKTVLNFFSELPVKSEGE